jgi:uncharacterized protein YneR
MNTNTAEQITFSDGFTVKLGDKVKFHTRYGSDGTGVAVAFGRSRGATTVKIVADEPEKLQKYGDRSTLCSGGFANRLEDEGVWGGEIERPEGFLSK